MRVDDPEVMGSNTAVAKKRWKAIMKGAFGDPLKYLFVLLELANLKIEEVLSN